MPLALTLARVASDVTDRLVLLGMPKSRGTNIGMPTDDNVPDSTLDPAIVAALCTHPANLAVSESSFCMQENDQRCI